MHKPYGVIFDIDIEDDRGRPVRTERRTVYISARSPANAVRRFCKRAPGCRPLLTEKRERSG